MYRTALPPRVSGSGVGGDVEGGGSPNRGPWGPRRRRSTHHVPLGLMSSLLCDRQGLVPAAICHAPYSTLHTYPTYHPVSAPLFRAQSGGRPWGSWASLLQSREDGGVGSRGEVGRKPPSHCAQEGPRLLPSLAWRGGNRLRKHSPKYNCPSVTLGCNGGVLSLSLSLFFFL